MKKYILLLMLFSVTVVAKEPATIASVAASMSIEIIKTLGLLFNLAYLLGVVVFVSGLFFFHKNGSQPNQGHLKTAIVSLAVGASLLAFPTVIETALNTIYTVEKGSNMTFDN